MTLTETTHAPVGRFGETTSRLIAIPTKKLKSATATAIKSIERKERARQSYCVVATGEGALYANIILKKGVVK